jgi:hypothetical protein
MHGLVPLGRERFYFRVGGVISVLGLVALTFGALTGSISIALAVFVIAEAAQVAIYTVLISRKLNDMPGSEYVMPPIESGLSTSDTAGRPDYKGERRP